MDDLSSKRTLRRYYIKHDMRDRYAHQGRCESYVGLADDDTIDMLMLSNAGALV